MNNYTHCLDCTGTGTIYDPAGFWCADKEEMLKQFERSRERGYPHKCEACNGAGVLKATRMTDEEVEEWRKWKERPMTDFEMAIGRKI